MADPEFKDYKLLDRKTGKVMTIRGPVDATDDELESEAERLSGPIPEKKPIPVPEFEKQAARIVSGGPTSAILGNPAMRFIAGMGEPLLGAAQLISPMLGQGPANEMRQRVASMNDAISRGREAYDSEGLDMARIGGNVASPLMYKLLSKMPVGTTPAGRIASGGLAGAVLGQFIPSESDDTGRLADTALYAGLGAAIPGAIEGVKKGFSIGKNIIGPIEGRAGRMLNDVAGENRDAVIAALRNAKSPVPGVNLNMGQASVGSGSSEIAALQEILNNINPSKLGTAGLTGEQQRARQAYLQSGGNLADILQMEVERDAVTGPMRTAAIEAANTAGQKNPALLEQIAQKQQSLASALQNQGQLQTLAAQQGQLAGGSTIRAGSPEMRRIIMSEPMGNFPADRALGDMPLARPVGAWRGNEAAAKEAAEAAMEAARIAQQRSSEKKLSEYVLNSIEAHGLKELKPDAVVGAIDSQLKNPSVGPVPLVADYLGTLKNRIAEWTDPKTGVIDANALYAIRKNIGKNLEALAESNNQTFDKKLAQSIESSVQRAIDDAIEGAGGTGWKEYLKKYSTMSAKISDAETASKLTDILKGSLGTQERASAFATAANKAPIETARTQAIVGNVQSDLARDATMDILAKEGGQAALKKIGSELPSLPATGPLNAKYTIARTIINRMHNKGTDTMLRYIADNSDNPRLLADLMEAATPKERPVISKMIAQQQARAVNTLMQEKQRQ
jgi:hypothetical protein